MKSKLKTFTVWIIMGIIFIVLLSSIMDNTNTKLTYSDLIAKMELGEVKKIELTADGEGAYVTLAGETIPKEVNIPNMESFMNYATELLKDGNPVKIGDPNVHVYYSDEMLDFIAFKKKTGGLNRFLAILEIIFLIIIQIRYKIQ